MQTVGNSEGLMLRQQIVGGRLRQRRMKSQREINNTSRVQRRGPAGADAARMMGTRFNPKGKN